MIDAGAHLARMRDAAPLVHNITNFVAMNIQANVLLAAGASPAMIHAAEESPVFAAIAASVSINIGTADAAWGESMVATATAAHAAGTPWVLDPVAVGASTFRRALCDRLVAARPTVIRGNASEILALGGFEAGGTGPDAGDTVEAAREAATLLARRVGGVVAITGDRDIVADGERSVEIGGGHPLMARVTAMGCSLTGLVAAFLPNADPFEATAAALAYYGAAGGEAADGAAGPGSFQPRFLDALHGMTPDRLRSMAGIAAS